MTPFNNSQPEHLRRRLRFWDCVEACDGSARRTSTSYRTGFVRIPDHDAAMICISNNGTSDPYNLAFQIVDTLIEAGPRARRAAMPKPQRLPGRWLDRDSGATVDAAIDKSGSITRARIA